MKLALLTAPVHSSTSQMLLVVDVTKGIQTQTAEVCEVGARDPALTARPHATPTLPRSAWCWAK